MFDLYTSPTPNGWKASCTLEELGLAYTVKPVNLMKQEQKTAEFLAMNPNGRIPVIENTQTKEVVFESGAIMIYLAELTGKLLPTSGAKRYEVLQWLMFQMGGVGPMMGQANVFFRYFPEKIPAAIDRYQTESQRLLSVLDQQLSDKEFLCDEFSIADIANWCWARTHEWSGVDISEMTHLKRWIDTMHAREGCYKGIKVPGKVNPEDIVKSGKTLIV
jgi:glutathione S-transferase